MQKSLMLTAVRKSVVMRHCKELTQLLSNWAQSVFVRSFVLNRWSDCQMKIYAAQKFIYTGHMVNSHNLWSYQFVQ